AIIDNTLKGEILRALPDDLDFGPMFRTLKDLPVDEPVPTSLLHHFTLDAGGLLWYDQGRLCVPRGPWRTKLLHDHHDVAIAGHQGIERTYATLQPHRCETLCKS